MPELRLPPANDYERSVLRNVETFGWHRTSASSRDPDAGEPPFSYTVGLHQSYGGPEFIMFGLNSTTAHSILDLCAERLKDGRGLNLSEPNYDLIEGSPCLFVEVPRHLHYDYVYSALSFYAELEFPLYQVVWPDREGYFPWHPAATDDFRASQPVLGNHSDV
jgi:hypothetical protein